MYSYYSYSYRFRRNKLRRLLWTVAGILLLLTVLFRVATYLIAVTDPPPGKHNLIHSLISWIVINPEGILRAGVPLMARVDTCEKLPPLASAGETVKPIVGMFMLDRERPLNMLQSQMPLMESVGPPSGEEAVAVITPEPEFIPLPDDEDEKITSSAPLSEENLVAVYFTHTGETYALTDGMERLHGKKGGVVKVGEALKQELEEKHGIRVVLADTINDTIYGDSYIVAQETLRRLLDENPAVRVVLDIHRDAGKSRENSLVTVNGQEVAPVLMVVGSDARDSFPAWRENYDFARELAAEIEQQHPGLCLGVQVKEGRYNQFLHPRSILLEVGSVSNSTEEAVQTGRFLAGPVAELVKRSLDEAEE